MASQATFLVSYPKSGNTWCRFLFANILSPPEATIDFNTVVQVVPEWEQRSAKPTETKAIVYKSHASFSPEFARVIYIVRDPRAAYLSYYRFFRKHLPGDETVESLALTPDKLAFGSWSAHVLSWYSRPGVRIYKYEDLSRDTESVLASMLEYAHVEFHLERLRAAIANSSFENMKRLEETRGRPFLDEQSRLRASPFMRKGDALSWQNELTLSERRAIEDKNARAMALLGYL